MLIHFTTSGSLGPLCSSLPKNMLIASTPPLRAPQIHPDLPTPIAIPDAILIISCGTSSSKLSIITSITASQQKNPLRYDSSASACTFAKSIDFAFTFILLPPIIPSYLQTYHPCDTFLTIVTNNTLNT